VFNNIVDEPTITFDDVTFTKDAVPNTLKLLVTVNAPVISVLPFIDNLEPL
jgi:hypothetical protein